MKKFLAIFSLIAVLGCSIPVSAHEVHHGNYHYNYSRPPRHEVVVHHYNDMYYHRRPPRPPRPHYYYSHSYYYTPSRAGAVITGIAAGAILTGIFASIAD